MYFSISYGESRFCRALLVVCFKGFFRQVHGLHDWWRRRIGS
ncbi:hypothetical protein ROSINTL182_08064 [Roseburia intestinalis L1-82]|uniref:Uncharacterized protein n=1 Tax=Roseburia intestinalis L1-82 TaxID=536231 RepID=C7GDR3_9FIRM|nr:hypothetical protein ROSINTL182_08064 [Roseburia intestinalis L1-82]DAE57277.1 MAG TPA: Protein of unknown function (DUF1156) [Bacteriophage sp.]